MQKFFNPCTGFFFFSNLHFPQAFEDPSYLALYFNLQLAPDVKISVSVVTQWGGGGRLTAHVRPGKPNSHMDFVAV